MINVTDESYLFLGSSILNVSPSFVLLHHQILAFKCYMFLSWYRISEDNLLRATAVFLGMRNGSTIRAVDWNRMFELLTTPEGVTLNILLNVFLSEGEDDYVSKFWAVCMFLVMLLMLHKEVNDVAVYFFCLWACFLCDCFQLLLDFCFMRHLIMKNFGRNDPLPLLACSCLAWSILPFDITFRLFLVYFICILPSVSRHFYLALSYTLSVGGIFIYHDSFQYCTNAFTNAYESLQRNFYAQLPSMRLGGFIYSIYGDIRERIGQILMDE